jgi:8-oxo-dGTP pyrophosphatase MutT (NUDIX family)
MSDENDVKPDQWVRISSEQMADCKVFTVRRDLSRNRRNNERHNFFCIEAVDWINIIPLTADNEVVMIEQFRHGIGHTTLEIPGGMVDGGESVARAAVRELREETGYTAESVIELGRTRPNPAIQNNWVYHFVARDVKFVSAPVFDGTEHAVTKLVPLNAVPGLIDDGSITHSLVVAGFARYWIREKGISMA